MRRLEKIADILLIGTTSVNDQTISDIVIPSSIE